MLCVDRRTDRVRDVREAADVPDAVPLLARQEHLGRGRVDEHQLVGVHRAEAPELVSRQLRRAEEVDVQGGLAGLRALDREVLAEDSFLRRLVAEQQQGRGPREAAAESVVEDRDPRLRARARRPRRLHHIRTSGAGSCKKGCQEASTWRPRMWWMRTSMSIELVKRISTTPSTRDRRRFIVIGSWTPSWTAERMNPRFILARDVTIWKNGAIACSELC